MRNFENHRNHSNDQIFPPNKEWKFVRDTVVAACVGLSLCPVLAADVLKKAGFSPAFEKEYMAYMAILATRPGISIEEFQNILERNGIKRLALSKSDRCDLLEREGS